MEKQDLDNLQQTTKDYSMSAIWLSSALLSIVSIVSGYILYFHFYKLNEMRRSIVVLSSLALILILSFASEYLNRALMRKSLGYVKQKDFFTSGTQKFLRQKAFPVIFIILLGVFPILIKEKSFLDGYYFLVIGSLLLIAGLINYSKTNLYGGVFVFVSALIWIGPMKHVFYAHEMSSWGIIFMTLGVKGMISGVIDYFKYKDIIQKVKRT